MQAYNEQVQTILANLQKTGAELHACTTQVNMLITENTQLSNMIDEMRDERTQLEVAMDELKQEADARSEQLQARIDALTADLLTQTDARSKHLQAQNEDLTAK